MQKYFPSITPLTVHHFTNRKIFMSHRRNYFTAEEALAQIRDIDDSDSEVENGDSLNDIEVNLIIIS